MGIEVYLQTTFGSPAFDAGTRPSMNLLVDQSLPLGIGFEYNFGIAGVQNGLGLTRYQFNFAWSFQRHVGGTSTFSSTGFTTNPACRG